MQYSELISFLESTAASYRGTLDFGVGTDQELNTGTHSYPLMWVGSIVVGNSITQSIVSQAFRVNVRILQSGSLGNTNCEDRLLFDETFRIINGLTDKIFRELQGNDSVDSISVGDITQLYRTQDNVHIGWQTTLTIGSYVDNDCCNLFE